MNDTTCIFCRIISNELPAQIIAQYVHTVIIADRAPKADIHWLAIPRVHVEDMRSAAVTQESLGILFSDCQRAMQDYGNNAAWKCVVNNGHEAGQRVFHLHAHILSGNMKGVTSL